jgi:hypothetical protein
MVTKALTVQKKDVCCFFEPFDSLDEFAQLLPFVVLKGCACSNQRHMFATYFTNLMTVLSAP